MGNNQNIQPKVSILDKNVDIDPVGVIYNVTGSSIEDFIYSYLTGAKKIDGVGAVRVEVIRDGAQRPEIAIHVLLDMNSQDVVSNMNTVPEHLRAKMDEGVYRATEKLRNAMFPICREFKMGVSLKYKVLSIRCDEFKVIGLMFAADPRLHQISIIEVSAIKKGNSVISVLKKNKFADKDDSKEFDKYSAAVQDIEDR